MNMMLVLLPIIFCSYVDALPLTEIDRINAINQHNKMRATLGSGGLPGPATNMKVLKWNTDLASKAQEYAYTCQNSQQSLEDREISGYKYVGQNIGDGADVMGILLEWESQKSLYDYANDNCNYNSWGEFLQAIWADTDQFGCGLAVCNNPSESYISSATMQSSETANETVSFQTDFSFENSIFPAGIVPSPTENNLCEPLQPAMPTEKSCVFPFFYNDQWHNECLITSYTPWCSLDEIYSGAWEYCDYTRADDDSCQFPFEYNGNTYNSCVKGLHGRYWCSSTSVYSGAWLYCY